MALIHGKLCGYCGSVRFQRCDYGEADTLPRLLPAAMGCHLYLYREGYPLDSVGIMTLLGFSNAHPEFAHPIMNLPRIRAAVTKNQAAPHRRFRVA
jgi:hypothetical protein